MPVDRFGPSMRSMLGWGGRRYCEALQGLFDVAGHGNVAGLSFLVPALDSESKKFVAFPVGGEDVNEMLGIIATGVFHAEVINDSKGNVSRLVPEEPRGVFGLRVTIGSKVFDEAIVANLARLR